MFIDYIISLPQNRVLFSINGNEVDVARLINIVKVRRNKLSILEGQSVAISSDIPLECIYNLVTLDGLALEILLLPSSLSLDERTILCERVGCNFILVGDRIQSLKESKINSTTSNVQSKWILATSGTTGTPKLISHSFETLSCSVKNDVKKGASYTWGLMYDPCRFAGIQVVLQSLLSGSTLVLPEKMSYEYCMKSILNGNVNAISATPSYWRKLLMDARFELLAMKQVSLGGEIVDQPLLDHLKQIFPGARIVHIYASTEAGVGFAVSDMKAGFPSEWLSSGIKGVFLKIDSENHLLVKPRKIAEGDEIASRMKSEGFLDTGDLVEIKNDRVCFVGRASGAINVGGNKVHPEEVENVIREIPGILEVRVYGKKNPFMGQLVVAELMVANKDNLTSLIKEVKKYCSERLEPYKVPALLNIVEKIEHSHASKIDRKIHS